MSSERRQPPAPRLASREPHLLRFHLRHMFLMVTLASVLCAALVATEGPWPMMIGVAALLVAAHVLGNLIGTRLRDTSDEVRQWAALQPGAKPDLPLVTDQPLRLLTRHLPPSTPLGGKERIARWTMGFVMIGLLIGLIGGAVVLALTIGPRLKWAGWVVGILSSGVLGAWLAFLGSTFSSIARHAWRHANHSSR